MTTLRALLSASLPAERLQALSARLTFSREAVLSFIFVACAVAFNLYYLLPEVTISVPRLNDGVLHALLLQHTVRAIEHHQNPTDFWFAPVDLGYSLFHYYQHLPYLPPALVSVATRGALSPSAALSWTTYLLLSMFPLVIYWSMRRFGFERLPAACGGLLAPLISTNYLYGFDYGSYVWRGSGLYTQLWAMILLPLAMSQGYRALRDGRGYVWAVLLLSATLMCHLVYGYMALITMVLLALVVPRPRELFLRGRRLALVFAASALVISYFVVPFLLDNAYLNRSIWEERVKYDSFGFPLTMHRLFHGQLFDYGHFFPSLTLLVAGGLLVCLWRFRDERFRIPVLIGVVWLVLYFGRATWGPLFDLLPFSQDLHMHRFIGGVHLGGIMLMGIGLAAIWRWALPRRDVRWLAIPLVVTGALLYPAFRDRIDYLSDNKTYMQSSSDAYAADSANVNALIDTLRKMPPGRVYAGLGNNWGRDYRVGDIPMYGLLNSADFDMYGFLYHALSLNAEVQVLFDDSRQDEYNLYNVRYVVAPVGHTFPSFVRPVKTFGRHELFEVHTTGYFDLVGADVAFEGDKAQLYPASSAWLKTSLPALKENPAVFLNGGGATWHPMPLTSGPGVIPKLSAPSDAPRGRVVSESVNDETYRASVQVDRDSYLLFKSTYHPNWHAYVDGVEVKTVMLMPSFLGIPIGPGTHSVRVVYRPQAIRNWLLVLGGLTLAGLAVAERRRPALDRFVAGRMAAVLGRLGPILGPRLGPAVEGVIRRWKAVTGPAWKAWATRESSVRGRMAALGRGWRASIMKWLEDIRRRGWRASATGLATGVREGPGGKAWATGAVRRWPVKLGPHAPYLIGLVLLTVAAGLPLFHLKLMSGHDTLGYPPRYVEFYEGLKDGQLVPRWAGDLAFGHGEPTFNFNPPLLYYLVSGVHALGLTFIQSEDVVLFVLLAISALGMYLLANDVFGRRGAIVAAAAYLFAPYLLVSLYVRHGLADYSAFAFIPFAFWGLFAGTTKKSTPHQLAGAIAIAALMLTSVSVAFITVPALVALLAALAWRERSLPALLGGCWCIALGFGLSAFFWMPAMRETRFVHFSRREEAPLNFHDHFVYIQQLIYSRWGYGFSVPGPGDGLSFGLGPVHLILTAAALVLLRPLWRASARAGLLVASFLVLLLASVFFMTGASLFVWERVSTLRSLQFPWRFLSLAAPCTALLCGAPFVLLRADTAARRRLANVLMLAAIAAILLWGFRYAHPQSLLNATDGQFSPENIAAKGLAATRREFEPIDVQQFPAGAAKEPISVLSGSAAVTATKTSVTERQFFVRADQDAQLRMNTFYFPGWTLYVDGERQTFSHAPPAGMMDFSLRRGAHTVRFEFHDTPVRTWSERLSLASLAVLLLAAGVASAGALTGARSGATPGGVAGGSRAAPTRGGISTRLNATLQRLPGVVEVWRPAAKADVRPPPETVPEPAAPPSVRVPPRLLLGLYLLFFSVYFATTSGHFFNTDEVAVYDTSQSLAEDRDLAIGPVLNAYFGRHGYYYAPYGTAQPALSTPLYVIGRSVERAGPDPVDRYFQGPNIGQHGGTVPIFFVSLFNAFVVPLICLVFLHFCLRLGYSLRASVLTTLALGLATELWVSAHHYFQHPLETLFLFSAVYVLFAQRGRVQARQAVLAGGLLALGVLARTNTLLLAPALVAYLLYIAPRGTGERASRAAGAIAERLPALPRARPSAPAIDRALWFALPVATAVALIVGLNELTAGAFTLRPHATGDDFALSVLPRALYANLLSPGRSFFLYSPPLVLGLLLLPGFARRYRAEAILFVAIAAMYLFLYSSFIRWQGGYSWGPRYLLPAVPFLMLPVAGAFESGAKRALAAAGALLAALGAGIQTLGVLVNVAYAIFELRARGLVWDHNVIFHPTISAIPTHFRDLVHGRNIDLWLGWVYHQFPLPVFLVTLALPLALMAAGAALTWGAAGAMGKSSSTPPQPLP